MQEALVEAVIDSLLEEPVEEIEQADGEVQVIEVDSRHEDGDDGAST